MNKLLEKLIEKEFLEKKDISALENEVMSSNKKEEEIILEKNIIPEEALFQVKSEAIGVPLFNVEEEVSFDILNLIPEGPAKFYKMVPIQKEGETLKVGMVYPEDLKAQEVLNFLARQNNLTPEIFLITIKDFEKTSKRYKTLKKEFSQALESIEEEPEDKKGLKKRKEEEEKTMFLTEDAPIIRMVSVILKYAVDGGASDIHIEPFKDNPRVRFRTDGVLHNSIFIPEDIYPAVVARIKILSSLKIDETRIPQDGRFNTTVYKQEVSFRTSTFPTILGEKVVMRVLKTDEATVPLEKLGLTGRNLRLMKESIKKPYGLILVTGPTGSGKTTTLYSLLEILSSERTNVVTLEDPVEYFLEGVNHSQIRPDIGYGFAEGLRHILRQDPDVIMVGEARDEETATLMVHAALTGHIALSTLHANNAIGVIPRIIDMGVEPFLIPSALSLAISQRLVYILCPHCKEKKQATGEALEIIKKETELLPEENKKDINIDSPEIYEAKGCKRCNGKGHKGRTGLFEILEVTEKLSEIITNNPTEERVWEEAKRQGMITLRQDGVIKSLKGITSMEEVLSVTGERQL